MTNIAKRMTVAEVLKKIGLETIQRHDAYWLYPSPVTDDGFICVDIVHDTWMDTHSAQEGDYLSLIKGYLKAEGNDPSDADVVRWIDIMTGETPRIEPVPLLEIMEPANKLVVKKRMAIKRPGLKYYLAHMGIPVEIAEEELSQYKLYNQNTKRYSYILGLGNESEGLQLQSPFYAGYIGEFDISFIRGTVPKPDGVHVFADIVDYLAAVVGYNKGRPFIYDAIIIHCLSILSKATPYIKGYGYRMLCSWMDNTAPGQTATQSIEKFCQTEEGLTHKPKNMIYSPYKSVKAWHIANVGSLMTS